jgi:hypothetical protein
MRASKESPDGTHQPPPSTSTVILLLATIADTTWRMFVPTLGGTAFGLWLDAQWRTTPWLGLAGLGLGIIITSLLVRQQLKKAQD